MLSASVTARISTAFLQVGLADAALGQDDLAGLVHQLGRGAVVDGLEMRGDPGLEREAAQERLAEAVDGHDVEAAGKVEHAGEEAAGVLEGAGGRGLAQQVQEVVTQAGLVALHGPAGEPALDPDRHLGGGGLGEGEAQDRFGGGTGEEEAQHAVGEDAGLAGAGIGRDPDRAGGVGGAALGRGGGVGDAHGVVPASRHSAMRARWS